MAALKSCCGGCFGNKSKKKNVHPGDAGSDVGSDDDAYGFVTSTGKRGSRGGEWGEGSRSNVLFVFGGGGWGGLGLRQKYTCMNLGH